MQFTSPGWVHFLFSRFLSKYLHICYCILMYGCTVHHMARLYTKQTRPHLYNWQKVGYFIPPTKAPFKLLIFIKYLKW